MNQELKKRPCPSSIGLRAWLIDGSGIATYVQPTDNGSKREEWLTNRKLGKDRLEKSSSSQKELFHARD